MSRRDDLVAKLREKIADALSRLKDFEAAELLMMGVAASEAKANAVKWGDALLGAEADRLSDAVDRELDDRGGEKYLRAERLSTVQAMDTTALSKAETADIIDRVMQAKAISVATSDDHERSVMEAFVERGKTELAARGVTVEVVATEVKSRKKAEASTPKTPVPPVPSPSEIINGVSPPDVPRE
jgi:FKBP-type peptidyl-prolyl cis-trans isomerase (trigger factor)